MSVAVPAAVAIVLCVLGGLHVFWAFGGSTPGLAIVPERDGKPIFRPSRAATLAVAAALFAAAFIVASRGGLISPAFPGSPTHWATIGIGLVFLLRAVGEFRWVGFFKRRRGTRFATLDTWVYSPLCLALASGFLYVATLP